MQNVQHLQPATLTAIVADLHLVRWRTRDDACAALASIKACIHHGATVEDDFVVLPSDSAKAGFYIVSAAEAASFELAAAAKAASFEYSAEAELDASTAAPPSEEEDLRQTPTQSAIKLRGFPKK